MKRLIRLGGGLLAILAGLYACGSGQKVPFKFVSASRDADACVPSGGAAGSLCVDNDAAGRGGRVTLKGLSSNVRCVRARSAEGKLAFVDPSDEADRTEVELAPVSSETAFVVAGLKREGPRNAPVLVLDEGDLEIQVYELPCWQVCRESLGKTTIRLGGDSRGIVVTENGDTPVCPVLGPLNVVIPADAGAGAGGSSTGGSGGAGGSGGNPAAGGSGGTGGRPTAAGGAGGRPAAAGGTGGRPAVGGSGGAATASGGAGGAGLRPRTDGRRRGAGGAAPAH